MRQAEEYLYLPNTQQAPLNKRPFGFKTKRAFVSKNESVKLSSVAHETHGLHRHHLCYTRLHDEEVLELARIHPSYQE